MTYRIREVNPGEIANIYLLALSDSRSISSYTNTKNDCRLSWEIGPLWSELPEIRNLSSLTSLFTHTIDTTQTPLVILNFWSLLLTLKENACLLPTGDGREPLNVNISHSSKWDNFDIEKISRSTFRPLKDRSTVEKKVRGIIKSDHGSKHVHI